MANHKSTIKRIRQDEKKRVENKFHSRTARNAVKVLRKTSNKEEAVEMLPKVSGLLDKLAKRNTIHKNKAANIKSGLAKHVASL